jgi:hypothetical protein
VLGLPFFDDNSDCLDHRLIGMRLAIDDRLMLSFPGARQVDEVPLGRSRPKQGKLRWTLSDHERPHFSSSPFGLNWIQVEPNHGQRV